MHTSSGLVTLLLSLTIAGCLAITWDQERLQWLVVTPPNQRNVQLNCTSEHIYPFRLLNDSSVIGALDSPVKRIWWVLQDGRLANATFDDGNRRAVDRGVGLFFSEVTENVYGLYHCAVEANYAINDTLLNFTSTSVYYYKRGLNLYGADLYGGNTWERYKWNTLVGSLTAGIFLAFVAGYALLDRLGILAKCNNSVEAAPAGSEEIGEGAPAAAAANAAFNKPASAEMTPAISVASVRSRKSEKPAPETETAAL